tara:strand:- start:1984 stop:2163 length:180 start_codon:yes stop_codon:yes gene_type:complete
LTTKPLNGLIKKFFKIKLNLGKGEDLISRILIKKVFTKKKWLFLKLSLMFVFTLINVLK